MKTYLIDVTEIYTTIKEVEAESETEAMEKIKQSYKNNYKTEFSGKFKYDDTLFTRIIRQGEDNDD